MWGTSSLPLLPSPLCPGVEALERVLSMDQAELLEHINYVWTSELCSVEMLEIELFEKYLFAYQQVLTHLKIQLTTKYSLTNNICIII